MAEVKYRISKWDAVFAIGITLAVDLLQFGLNFSGGIGGILNPFIVTPTFYLCAWIWLHFFRNIKLGSRKNIIAVFIGSILELIPFIDLIPALTFVMTRIIINSRVEDLIKSSAVASKIVNKAEVKFNPDVKVVPKEPAAPQSVRPTNLAKNPGGLSEVT